MRMCKRRIIDGFAYSGDSATLSPVLCQLNARAEWFGQRGDPSPHTRLNSSCAVPLIFAICGYGANGACGAVGTWWPKPDS
jgi:hypothetical protein